MAAKPVPPGHRAATPYLIIKEAARAIEFYKQAFGAVELLCLADPTGRVEHAEIRIGEAPIMLADETPDIGAQSPQSLGGSPVCIHLYVDDVDALAERALAAGIKVVRPVKDQFYGDRSGTFADPFGHIWTIATHKEDLTPEEIQRRVEAARKQTGA
jgi:PhnB protein